MTQDETNLEAESSSSFVPTSGMHSNSERFSLSPTVSEALKRFAPDEPICAASFTRMILRLYNHAEKYAAGRLVSLQLEDTPQERTAQEWLDEVQTLFDPARVAELSKSAPPPALHGRLVIIGLSLLEPQLRRQLDGVGALAALVEELWQPLPDILTERGRALYYGSSESVPNWPDDPLQEPEEDLLGRAAFARFLAGRIAAISPNSGAYAIHIYGPWGAGKSTLLNFLRAKLTADREWLVVDFNAWRNQHIQPPWWSLMDRTFKETKRALNPWEKLQEYWWRFNTGRLQYVLGLIVLVWILVLFVFPWLRNETADAIWGLSAAAAENFSKILALITTVWGGILAFNRSLLLSSARAAQCYTDLIHDPTSEIKKRFETLVERLRPKRLAIFIDDLDRCQSSYVVELLEGIQTLFREAPVVFVVAADHRWLNACYEQVYEKLKPQVQESGKSLGALFLEKAFRFSTPMPGITEDLKKRYWLYLLQVKSDEREADLSNARNRARESVSQAQSEGQLQQLVANSRGQSFAEQRAIREEAIVRLAAKEITERLEHALKPYAELLEANPRAMKRLVNTYSANRALAILSEVEIERHQLVLWTILSSRWPQLAAHLEEFPESVEKLDQKDAPGISDELKALFGNQDVIQVTQGGSTRNPLNRSAVEQCTRLCVQ